MTLTQEQQIAALHNTIAQMAMDSASLAVTKNLQALEISGLKGQVTALEAKLKELTPADGDSGPKPPAADGNGI